MILLVEDDADLREVLADILIHEGYEVKEAEDGAVALEWIASHPPPCVILLDMMMPNVSGWDVLKALDEHPDWRSIQVIVLSASTSVPIGPGRRHMKKPVQLEVLLSAVAEVC